MISVIVPVYNVEVYLKQCVDSILGQTYSDLEVLLVDDGSPDSCGKICDEYSWKDDRVRVFHTENHGLSAARNLALREAKGEFVTFVDSDDWIDPKMCETLLGRIKETNADICVCGYLEERGIEQRECPARDAVLEGPEVLRVLLKKQCDYHAWDKLCRKELFRNICFPVGKNYEDVETTFKVMKEAEKAVMIPDTFYHYRIREKSITQTYSARNLIDFSDAYLNSYDYLYENVSEELIDREELLFLPAYGLSKLWRWWYGCGSEEKAQYRARIGEMVSFVKEHFPLFGFRSWPAYLRVTVFFMHSRSGLSFAMIYGMNRLFRKLRPRMAYAGE